MVVVAENGGGMGVKGCIISDLWVDMNCEISILLVVNLGIKLH